MTDGQSSSVVPYGNADPDAATATGAATAATAAAAARRAA